MRYVFSPPPPPSLPVHDGDGDGDGDPEPRFPVRRVFCVGRNYAAHAREMGADPSRDPPVFFTKPADAVLSARPADGAVIAYPPATRDYQHEIELVVAVGVGGREIERARALEHVWGYAVGLDMTRRDLQAAAKKAGQPWDMAKGFDQSAPCSAIVPAARIGHPARGRIQLLVNDSPRQEADVGDMIWSVADVLFHLSRLVTLAPGDLVFTGTPEGVGPVAVGDRLAGSVEGVGALAVTIGPAAG